MLVFSQSGAAKVQYALERTTPPDEAVLVRYATKLDKKINEFDKEARQLFELSLNSVFLTLNSKKIYFYYNDFIQLKENKK